LAWLACGWSFDEQPLEHNACPHKANPQLIAITCFIKSPVGRFVASADFIIVPFSLARCASSVAAHTQLDVGPTDPAALSQTIAVFAIAQRFGVALILD
jgi:hypothetical protein